MLFPLNPYTRARSQNYSENLSYPVYNTTVYNGTVSEPWKIQSVTPVQDTVGGSWIQEEMHDVESPNWRKLWTKRIATVNPMEQTRVIWNKGVGDYFVRRIARNGVAPNYYYSGIQYSGSIAIGDTPSTTGWNYPGIPSVDTAVIAEAITDCWAKVSLTESMVLAQAAELGKTIKFISSTLLRVLKIYRALRRFDLMALSGEIKPKELNQRYLEARYALRPLAYDIRNTILASQDKVPAKYSTFRAYKSTLSEETYPGFLIRQSDAYSWRVLGTAQAIRTLEVRTGVLTFVESVTPALRFGVGDILQTTWELLPWSFIVDWFFNIGKWISMWSPKLGLHTLASWYVVQDTTHLSVTAETGESWTSDYISIYNRTGSYSKVYDTKYRIPNPDRPLLPSFNLRMNSLKTLDIASIIAQMTLFRKKSTFSSRPRTNYGYAFFDD